MALVAWIAVAATTDEQLASRERMVRTQIAARGIMAIRQESYWS